MTIHDLLALFSPDDIMFQRLDSSAHRVRQNTKGTKVEFCTTLSAFDVTDCKIGLVLWIDAKLWDERVAEHKAAKVAERGE